MKKYKTLTHADKIEFLIDLYIEENGLEDITWEIIEEDKIKYLSITKGATGAEVVDGIIFETNIQIPTPFLPEDFEEFTKCLNTHLKARLEEIKYIKDILSKLNSENEGDEDE